MSGYAILFKTWKWLKLRNSVRFIKKTLLNNVYNWIWSFWLSFTVLQWMKTSFKISKFSRSLLRSGYAILLKIWKWLKPLNSVPFIKKTSVNNVYNWVWSFGLTFAALQWIKKNFKISQFEDFCLGPCMRFWSTFEKDQNLLILFHSSRKHDESMFTIELDHFDWLSQFYSEWRQTSKLVNFQDFC